jgi:hypothetical protein
LGDFPLNSAYEFAALNQTLWGLIIASVDASADDYDASTDDYENDDHDRAADVGRWSDQRHKFCSSKGGFPGPPFVFARQSRTARRAAVSQH